VVYVTGNDSSSGELWSHSELERDSQHTVKCN
jgi:hypothetical protein